MLLLSRRNNEKIMIGDDIRIEVMGIHQANVLLGISAPREVPIHRQEVYDRIHHIMRPVIKTKRSVNDYKMTANVRPSV